MQTISPLQSTQMSLLINLLFEVPQGLHAELNDKQINMSVNTDELENSELLYRSLSDGYCAQTAHLESHRKIFPNFLNFMSN